MKIKKYLMGLGLCAAMGLTACSSDEPAGNLPAQDGNGDAFYATVSLTLPTSGSRSATGTPGDDYVTSDGGTEDGQDYENNIKTIMVLLATLNNSNEYELRTVNQGDASNNTPSGGRPTYTVKFKSNEILDLANTTVFPFVVCNPDANLAAKLNSLSPGNTTFIDEIIALAGGDDFDSWKANKSFLMTNAFMDKTRSGITLPSKAELGSYTNPTSPFPLTQGGAVRVERTVARFDFKPVKYAADLDVNTYPVYSDPTTKKSLMGYVTLDGMALINEADEFYAFRRVSDDGLGKNLTIGGIETPINYVESPNADNLGARTYFFNAFTGGSMVAPSTLGYTNLSAISTSASDYGIWRYVTENTVPADGVKTNQTKKHTTGVVFKGHLTFPAGTSLATAADNGDVLYKFGTVVYGNYADLLAYIKANPNTLLAAKAYEAGIYSGFDAAGDLTDVALEGDSSLKMADNGFTLYRKDATSGRYEVYYYYWNRHNDNGDPTSMGAMEFGVVRNNVYKLAVNSISEFGHPASPGDDPDPENPDDPNETVDLYISLHVQVLPWTVRYNQIDF